MLLMLSLLALGTGTSQEAAAPSTPGVPRIVEDEGPGAPGATDRSVLVVGDSLAVGVEPHLAGALPGWDIETLARTGKHTSEGVAEIISRGELPGTLVVSLGTNDDPSDTAGFASRVGAVLDAAGPSTCVVWVNIVRPPYAGVSYAGYNKVLARAYASSPNLVLVDWAGLASADPGLLAPDGVHATPEGYARRAQAVAQAVRSGCGSFGGVGD